MVTIDLLAKEYFQLQTIFEQFDDRALLIKGWSITVTLALLVKAVELKSATIAGLSAGAACVFWLIEAMWKSFQKGFVPRMEQIESAFRASDPEISIEYPLQIYSMWEGRCRWDDVWVDCWWFDVPGTLFYPHVVLPHLVFIIIAVYLAKMFKATQSVG